MLIYYMKKLFVHKDNLIGLLKSEITDYAEQRVGVTGFHI